MKYASLFLPLRENFRNTVGDTVLPNKVYKNEIPSDVRPIAEYEEMGGVVIAYPGTVKDQKHPQLPPTGPRQFGIPNELIVRMQQLDKEPDGDEPDKNAVHIFILCADESQLGVILKDLGATAKELGLRFRQDLVHLVPWDTDTYWTRDYAPWWIFHGSTQRFGIANHRYTTLGGGSVGNVEGAEDAGDGKGIFRPNDEYGAVKLSDYFNAPIRKWNKEHKNKKVTPHEWFELGLLNVGGNYMSTTTGVVASSYLVATQNELPEEVNIGVQEKIDERMEYVLSQFNRFMGAHKYIGLSDPTGTYIGHIDCWGKFISDSKVVIADSKDPKIKAKLDEIASYLEQEGFTVYRIMCQPIVCNEEETTASYVNCFILNKVVYVPITGDPTYDNAAIKVFKDALGEEYTIIGILGKKETPWLGTDSIHCRTREIPRTVVNNWKRCMTSSFAEYKIRESYLLSVNDNLESVSGNLRSVSGNLEKVAERTKGVDTLVKVPYIKPAALKLAKKHVDTWSVQQIENDNKTRLYAVPVPSENSYIWVSDVPIDAGDVMNVYKHIRSISQTSTIHIDSGTHGDEDGKNVVDGGARYSEFEFFMEDLHTIANDDCTSIHVISSYAPEIYPFKNANHIILAWCYSIKTLARTEKMQDFLESWEQPREAQEVHLELDDMQNYYYQTMLPEKTVYATNPKHVFAVEKRHFQQK